MRRLLLFLAPLAACVQPLTQPEPKVFQTELSPVEVVRRVAAALTGLGFEVSVSDAEAGILTLKRARGPKGNADQLTCNWTAGSIADTHGASTITLSVSARAGTPGATSVLVTTRTMVSYPTLRGTVLASADSEDTCVSNGVAEAAAIASLTR